MEWAFVCPWSTSICRSIEKAAMGLDQSHSLLHLSVTNSLIFQLIACPQFQIHHTLPNSRVIRHLCRFAFMRHLFTHTSWPTCMLTLAPHSSVDIPDIDEYNVMYLPWHLRRISHRLFLCDHRIFLICFHEPTRPLCLYTIGSFM